MKRALALLLLLFIASPLFAFSIEDILSAPFPYELIAAKGRLAWAMNERGARNVWTAEGPKFEPRQLTKFSGDDGVDLGELTFSADGQWIAFTRGGDLETNGESPNPASAAQTPPQEVWTISLRDGAVRKIGEGSEPRISGSRVAFVAKKQLMLACFRSDPTHPGHLVILSEAKDLVGRDASPSARLSMTGDLRRAPHPRPAFPPVYTAAAEFFDRVMARP